MFFDKNQSVPYYQTENYNKNVNGGIFSSKQNLSLNKTRAQTLYSIEEMRESKKVGSYSSYKSNIINKDKFNINNSKVTNGLSTNYNSLTTKSIKEFSSPDPLTNNTYKDINTLYTEFITNVIYIKFIILIIIFL